MNDTQMITIKNDHMLKKMTEAGRLLAHVFDEVRTYLRPGRTTLEVDAFIEQELAKRQMISGSKGYQGYCHASCISLNDEVVHGVPQEKKVIRDGDLVKIDVCASHEGVFADMTRSFCVGSVSDKVRKLVAATQEALDEGIAQAKPGNYLTDISAAIQRTVEQYGFGVVRDFAGHGIGSLMHEEPEILNYGKPGMGPMLKHGMAFALEPMTTFKGYNVFIDNDGWTVKTADGSLAAHIEDTVLITDDGPRVVTRPEGGGGGAA